jgi:hypothetical protein
MSGAGDLLGTLGAVAPSAISGYTRGQARGLQFQIQQQRLNQQAQGLQDYRQQLIQLQQQGQQLKQQLAERQADQKELLRLTDLIQKKPHELQQTGQLEPTLTQWTGLYQKVHPGEPLPSFFGEQYTPQQTETTPLPLPQPLQAAGVAPSLASQLSPGQETRTTPAHFTGIPEIPLDEKTQAQIDATNSLIGRRGVQNAYTTEQTITAQLLREPRLQQILADTQLALARAGDVPEARRDAEARLGILAEGLGLNRERVREYLRHNMAGELQAAIGQTEANFWHNYQMRRNAAQDAQAGAKLPEAARLQYEALKQAYLARDSFGNPLGTPEQLEGYRRGMVEILRQHGGDPRGFLLPGEEGYDPSFAPAAGVSYPPGQGFSKPGAGASATPPPPRQASAPTLAPAPVQPPTTGGTPVGKRTGQPALAPANLPVSPAEMRLQYPFWPQSFGPGDPGPSTLTPRPRAPSPPAKTKGRAGGPPVLPPVAPPGAAYGATLATPHAAAPAAPADTIPLGLRDLPRVQGVPETAPWYMRVKIEGPPGWAQAKYSGATKPPQKPGDLPLSQTDLDFVKHAILNGYYPALVDRQTDPQGRPVDPQQRSKLLRGYWYWMGKPYPVKAQKRAPVR